MHKPPDKRSDSDPRQNKKLPICMWKKGAPNHPGKRLHPPYGRCPYMETTHLKRGFPDVTLADVDVPLWEMNSNLFDFIADVGVDVNVYLLLFASLFST